MADKRRKRRSKTKRKQKLFKNLKIYLAIFVGCFAIGMGMNLAIGLATGKLSDVFDKSVKKATTPLIETFIEDKVHRNLDKDRVQSIVSYRNDRVKGSE